MKKIFTLATAALLGAAAVNAQSIKLDKTKVIYTTVDTVTVDEGEKITFSSDDLVNAFNVNNLALAGTDSKDNGFFVAFRKDYTDSETGFTMPKGYYRGIEVQGTYNFFGTFVNASTQEEVNAGNGFTNIKKVILYIVPAGYLVCHDNGYDVSNWQTLFSGRVQAQYMNDDGTKKSNQAYQEITVSNTLYNTDDWQNAVNVIQGVNNYALLDDDAFSVGYNGAYITMDQPYKIAVDLTNTNTAKELEAYLADNEKPSDLPKINISTIDGEVGMKYYFAATGTCPSAADSRESGDSSSGYNVFDGKWGTKVDWSEKMPVQVGVKKGLILVGIAFVSATEGAEREYLDAGAGMSARFTSDANIAFGTPVDGDFPADPWADRRIGNGGFANISSVSAAATNAPVYNLQGQRVNANTKGILIQNGKKIVNQ